MIDFGTVIFAVVVFSLVVWPLLTYAGDMLRYVGWKLKEVFKL